MNQKEFMQVVAPFQNKLFRLAKRLLVSKEEAEDATQEILVKLWNKNKNLGAYTNVEAFAMTMTKNYCLDQLKSKRVVNSGSLSIDYQDRSTNLENQIEDQNTLKWVEQCIGELTVAQRTILQLREIEGQEFSEIAKIVEMNETAVRVALTRARKTLKDKIEQIQNHGIKN
jgi:RNA polymerase sigma factor (sigma-70 family)